MMNCDRYSGTHMGCDRYSGTQMDCDRYSGTQMDCDRYSGTHMGCDRYSVIGCERITADHVVNSRRPMAVYQRRDEQCSREHAATDVHAQCAVQSGAVLSVIGRDLIMTDHVVNSHAQWLFTPLGGERCLR
ncbi:hypothetical protein AB205_0030950, partial [Aquarana catesbeiana]